MDSLKKLVVIPSEPLHLYEKKGIYTWLERYYNPGNYFDKVYLVSPLEEQGGTRYGMEVIPVKSGNEFKKIIRKINPLCVRTYGAYWATSFGVINKVKDVPVVASIHDPNPAFIFKGITRASFIFSMSERLTDILLNKGISQDRILTTGNRVDFKNFKALDKDHIKVKEVRNKYPQGTMLLHVGRRTKVKNLITTVAALAHLPEDNFLVIVGRGLEENVEELIINLNLSHRIFSVLSVANNELPYWFNAADVFVTPSLWEGFGVVFLEAAACQVPIVTSDIAPLNMYLIADGSNVILVKENKDPKKIAEAVSQILVSLPRDNKTYAFIKEKYSQKAIESVEISFYNKLASGELSTSYTDSYIGRTLYALEYEMAQKFKKAKQRLKKSVKIKKLKRVIGL